MSPHDFLLEEHMRKTFISLLVAGGLAVAGGMTMAAHADSNCALGDPPNAGQLADDGDGNSGVQVCIGGTGVVDGTATIAGKVNMDSPPDSTGYIAVDGRPTNPSILGGYLGLQTGDDAGLVGCAATDSEFNQAEADETAADDAAEETPDENNSILRLDGTPPTVPPDTADPCFPPAPAPPVR
jgi:hypothetical protein